MQKLRCISFKSICSVFKVFSLSNNIDHTSSCVSVPWVNLSSLPLKTFVQEYILPVLFIHSSRRHGSACISDTTSGPRNTSGWNLKSALFSLTLTVGKNLLKLQQIKHYQFLSIYHTVLNNHISLYNSRF